MQVLLLIDDNDVMLHYYSKVLEKAGYQVETSESPVNAINLFRNKRHDLVITDYEMIIHDGVYVKNEIKYISNDTPVILLSGGANRLLNLEREFKNMIDEKMFFIKNFGFDDYVNKFWDDSYQELVSAVNRLIKKK